MYRKDKRKFFKNPWTVTIGGTAIGTIIASIALKTNLFIEALKIIWKFILLLWRLITLQVTLPVWVLIIMILLIPIIFLLILLLTPRKKETGPSPYEYKKDTFDGIVFRWKWEYSKYDNGYHIENLVAFCPICDCQLNVRYRLLVCPNCGFEKSDFNKSENELKMLIQHQVRKRYFPVL